MELQQGDWVETDSGLRDRIIHVSRLTAFVVLDLSGEKERCQFFSAN